MTYINQKVDYLKEDSPALGQDTEESGNASSIILEFGKRFKMGELAGINFTWGPSATYTVSSYDEEIAVAYGNIGAGSPDKTNEFKVNLLKVDGLF